LEAVKMVGMTRLEDEFAKFKFDDSDVIEVVHFDAEADVIFSFYCPEKNAFGYQLRKYDHDKPVTNGFVIDIGSNKGKVFQSGRKRIWGYRWSMNPKKNVVGKETTTWAVVKSRLMAMQKDCLDWVFKTKTEDRA
jgi:hypothetical protein